MLFERIDVLKADGTCLPAQYVGIEGSRIAYLSDTPPAKDYGERVDGTRRLLMAGLVNAHTHVAMTLMRGYGEDLPLQEWLFQRIFPFEDRLSAEAVYWGSLLGMAEMIASGTTSFTDMYYFCDQTVNAALECGIKANIGRGVTCFDSEKRFADLPACQELKELLSTAHGAGDGRICIDVAPHAEYTTRPDILEDCTAMAAQYGARMHIHLSETHAEHLECVGRHGKTPTRVLESAGVLGQPLTVAHGVWLTDSDVDCLAAHGVTLAHCPQSNLKLGSGIAPIIQYRNRELSVAIGTDSAASNNSLDMLAELRMAALLAKGTARDASALPAGEVLYMGTRAGALSQGREDCGDIAVGMCADLVMLDTSTIGFCPDHAPQAHLLYGAGSRAVCMTMVDGRVLYRNGDFLTMDIERIKHETRRNAEKIVEKL